MTSPDLGFGFRYADHQADWAGTRTDNADPPLPSSVRSWGLRLELDQPEFWMLKLPDVSKVELFGPDSPINRHVTGPVAGFLVHDVHEATAT